MNSEQALQLQKWEEVYDFWKPAISGFSADIMVEPGKHLDLSTKLTNHGIEFNEFINDLGKLIRLENIGSLNRNMKRNLTFDAYYNHDEVSVSLKLSHKKKANLRAIALQESGDDPKNICLDTQTFINYYF